MAANETINEVIEVERAGDIALIRIDNPPVNAAGLKVREGLVAAIDALEADMEVKAIGLYAAGRTFVAGADIREFGKPPVEPWLPDVVNRIEGCAKPVVVALHGTALGGGFEVALAAHYRVGAPGLRVGLPEVNLGIIPGAGGTQRAPRLAGMRMALDMITSGRHVPAQEALEAGLIDEIREGEPREIALAAAGDALAGRIETRRTGQIAAERDEAALSDYREKMAKQAPLLFAPHKCVDAVEGATMPIAEGMAHERALFRECQDSPQRAGLVHAFFAERAVAKFPEKDAEPSDLQKIGVIGGGTMGSGIATACLLAGYAVTLVEVSPDALERGLATVTKNLDGAVKRGKLDAAGREATLARLDSATQIEALGEADLVIEAVFEDMGVKKEIFAKLDATLAPGAIMATNTSYLDVNEIAAATSRPEAVLGLHFFSPAHVMKLVEIVVADRTAPEAVATGFALAKKLKKIGVRSGVCDGFIGNRIMQHYRKAADYMLLDGAHFEQVDRALEDFGFAMGPFRVSDLAGLDIGWTYRKRHADTRPAEERYVRIADRICEEGMFGRKTGRGFYLYGEGESGPNPAAEAIVESERAAAGVTPRSFSDEEVVARYMTAMITEAARVVEEGIAQRPIDVDAVLLFGYGFPRFRGGPLHYADQLGLAEVIRRIETYAQEDAHYWQVPGLLRRLAAEGKSFAELNP
ncbi:3-hydroxyacyl-CoA dehydrogenase NAD-binding domain-containing protein [Rhodosalinus sp.]|uniref:3-hydroxyacyl-CoA dehydrogenase NAD-binding domain-containing protein n=1 Tax=Rhodosalinus sp. TaxID=2047741 RepID=UPI003979526A